MHDIFMWIRSQLLTDNQLHPCPLPLSIQYQLSSSSSSSSSTPTSPSSSLSLNSFQEAIHPTILIYLLSKVIPSTSIPNEPDMSKVQGDPETLLTVYLNGCKRFGIIHLFPAHVHPIFAASTTTTTDNNTFSSSSTSIQDTKSTPIPSRRYSQQEMEDGI